jgi:hypothetical protein
MTSCDKRNARKNRRSKQMSNGGWDFLGFFLYLKRASETQMKKYMTILVLKYGKKYLKYNPKK